MTKLSKSDKDRLFEIASSLSLSTYWEDNLKQISELYQRLVPEIELATFWAQTNDSTFLTSGAEDAFGAYLKALKRGDFVQSDELVAIDGLENAYTRTLKMGSQVLGKMLLSLNGEMSVEQASPFVDILLPQLSLARFATEMQEEVEKRTSTDKLTGLWKRSYFNERFREESERLSRSKELGCVAVMGLDDLAQMVRMLPQDEQNNLLSQAGKTLRSLLRQTDWVVRWDNFEVLFYFPNTPPEAAVDVFARCVKALTKINPILRVVIGLCSTVETTSARGLIQLADKRLNLARKDGRHQLICYASRATGLNFWEYKD